MPSGIYKRTKKQIGLLKKLGRIWGRARRKYFPTICPVCQKEFQPKGLMAGKCTKTCSKKCGNESRRGKPTWLSEHVKEGVCLNTGRTNFKKGLIPWNRGKKSLIPPDKHYNWKGGISSENKRIRHGIEFKLWREAVFARDNWTCQDCGQRGGELEAHHIKPFAKFPELRTAIENGITYCIKCHRKNDKYRGKTKK